MIVNRIIYRDKPKADIFRSLVQTFWKDNPDCEVATISITKDKPKRSDAQNRLFHTWRDIIAGEMGESKEETKNLIKNQFSIESTKDLEVAEFVEFLRDIDDFFGGEYQIKLPRNEDYHLAMYNVYKKS
jgi:hypothetical protein|tara:strand:- start:95 stop:481 length:387 start_codon:yes stop_codon:yes gene_type:complete